MQLDVSTIKEASHRQMSMLPAVTVYSHAWKPKEFDDRICQEIHSRYKPKKEICENIIFDTRSDLYGYTHVQSMILSITKVLSLSQEERYDQLVLSRHDNIFLTPVPYFLPHQFVVMGSWETKSLDGIPDQSFAGDPIILQYVFTSLYARFISRQRIHNNTRAHFMIQAQLDELYLTRRGYVAHFHMQQSLLRHIRPRV